MDQYPLPLMLSSITILSMTHNIDKSNMQILDSIAI